VKVDGAAETRPNVLNDASTTTNESQLVGQGKDADNAQAQTTDSNKENPVGDAAEHDPAVDDKKRIVMDQKEVGHNVQVWGGGQN
jgi:hypothetical protein